jgi:hypothetical protein
LLFLAEKLPNLRIPRVLAVWSLENDQPEAPKVFCLMMNFIEGIRIHSQNFHELPVAAQDIVCSKVSKQIRDIRSLPSEGYYGRVHRQGWLHPPRALKLSSHRKLSGPYYTYEEIFPVFHDAFEIFNSMTGSDEDGCQFPPDFDLVMAQFLSVIHGWEPHEPTFTWLDPKLMNMIFQPPDPDVGCEEWDVYLVDWEGAGWYPAWAQSLQFRHRCGAIIVDRENQPSHSPKVTPYRKDEILPLMCKEFDPNPDHKRIDILGKLNPLWEFL